MPVLSGRPSDCEGHDCQLTFQIADVQKQLNDKLDAMNHHYGSVITEMKTKYDTRGTDVKTNMDKMA